MQEIPLNVPEQKINLRREYCKTTRERILALEEWIDGEACPRSVKLELYKGCILEMLKLEPQDRINETLSKAIGETREERRHRREEENEAMLQYFDETYLMPLSQREEERRWAVRVRDF